MANPVGSTFTGYGVGVPSFLNEAEHKVGRYWRLVEFGSEGFVGKYLGGLWSDSVGGQLSPFGEGRDQQFVPFGPQGEGVGGQNVELAKAAALKALGYLAATGQLAGSRALNKDGSNSQFAAYRALKARILQGLTGPTLGIVGKEFPAMGAYASAAAEFRPAEKERQAVAQVFGAMAEFSSTGRRTSVLSQGRGSRTPGLLRSAEFTGARGFVTGFVLSNNSRSLGNKVDQTLRHELTQVNRILAEQLAQATATLIGTKKVRAAVSTLALEEATKDARNRFPS